MMTSFNEGDWPKKKKKLHIGKDTIKRTLCNRSRHMFFIIQQVHLGKSH